MRGLLSAHFLTIVAGSLLVTTWPALADANAPEQVGSGRANFFGKIDKNGDGVIDRSEFDAWRQTIFMRIDASGDQIISLDEWQAVQDRVHRRHSQGAANENTTANESAGATSGNASAATASAARPVSRRVQKIFQMLDANGDGKISLDEWRVASDRLFDRRDLNKDGKISSDEFAAKAGHLPVDPVP